MVNRIGKLYLGFLSFLFFSFLSILPTAVGEHVAFAEERNTLILTEEVFDGDISRVYQNSIDGTEDFYVIEVPDEWEELVFQAKDPLLEAKRRLIDFYKESGDEESIDVLYHLDHPDYTDVSYRVDSSIKRSFDKQTEQLRQYETEGVIKDTNILFLASLWFFGSIAICGVAYGCIVWCRRYLRK